MKRKIGQGLLLGLGVLSIIVFIMIDPIAQDQKYQLFSDDIPLVEVPNFWNVISNLPFLLAGIYGIWHIKKITNNRLAYLTLLFRSCISCFGF